MSKIDKNSNEIVTVNPNNSLTINDSDIDELVKASASTGITSKGQWLMSVQKAKELGIGPGNALSHMHTVNGKTGIDIHIIKAILSRPSSGVIWELIDNFKPIYASYSDGNSIFNYEQLPKNYVIVTKISGNPKIESLINDGLFPVVALPTVNGNKKTVTPIDRITTYKFTRIKKNIKGEWITIITYSSFKWSEALAAKLPLDGNGNLNPNSNWQKYTKLMLSIRAFTFGARDIASDLLLGCYEMSELYDFSDIDYNINPEGTTTIIDNDIDMDN